MGKRVITMKLSEKETLLLVAALSKLEIEQKGKIDNFIEYCSDNSAISGSTLSETSITLNQLIDNNKLQLKLLASLRQIDVPQDVVKETRFALNFYQELREEMKNFKPLT